MLNESFCHREACFTLTDAPKLPPAAYFYYVATGHMSHVGRTTEVVKTGQEIAAKF